VREEWRGSALCLRRPTFTTYRHPRGSPAKCAGRGERRGEAWLCRGTMPDVEPDARWVNGLMTPGAALKEELLERGDKDFGCACGAEPLDRFPEGVLFDGGVHGDPARVGEGHDGGGFQARNDGADGW
jgi:hypothetical protein